jgi:glutathione S-transferase
MKLYYTPGACSLATHIVAREAGIELELDKVDAKSRRTASGSDYLTINPKGYVPALQLDDGEVLTEGPVVAQYLADRKPSSGLAPAAGTIARYRLMEMLGYINSEIHKTYSSLFNTNIAPATREERLVYLRKRYGVVEQRLSKHQYLVGDSFTIADAYLFTVTRWADAVKLDLSDFPNVRAFQTRIAARPAVQSAMKTEGLIH